jgi:dCTP deaminase
LCVSGRARTAPTSGLGNRESGIDGSQFRPPNPQLPSEPHLVIFPAASRRASTSRRSIPDSRFPIPDMSIQSDRWITQMALEHRMIEPFEGRQVRSGVISYGVSSYGYDMRVAREFRIFTNVLNSIVDPKNFDPKSFVEFEGDVCIVPPNSFALARSVEYFRIPRDVVTITVGKSTYARCGIITNVTPFEPEWEGYVTLEISNTTPLPAKIYANEGIAQVLFFKGSEPPEVSYRDKQGKYQGQVGVTLPKL